MDSGWRERRRVRTGSAGGGDEAVVRERALFHLGLADGSPERLSLLAELRKQAAAGATGFYDDGCWEGLRVAEGSASVALRMAEELGDRVRLGAPVAKVAIAKSGCTVTLVSGEELESAAVISAMPVGPLRDIEITGVSEARLQSLARQRSAATLDHVTAGVDLVSAVDVHGHVVYVVAVEHGESQGLQALG